MGPAVARMVEALRDKTECRGFDSLEFFIDIIFPGRTVALRSTQPLTGMSTRNIPWGGEGGRYVGLTTLPPSCADCLEIWDPQPPGNLRACPGLYRNCFACRISVFDTAFTTTTVQYILLVLYCTVAVFFHILEAAIFINLYMCVV
jgi:hypothetical protein